MTLKRKAFQWGVSLLQKGCLLFGKNSQNRICASIAEQIPPVVKTATPYGDVSFYCPGELPLWRARTLLTKEQDTIAWIDGFEEGGVFWDIGANIGVFSLYAARKGHTQILSFEPAAMNFQILTKNIQVNNMSESISAFCVAFNDTTKIDYFYMSSTDSGSALHSFGETYDAWGKSFTPVFKQAMVGFSIDTFLGTYNVPFPNYIKIDVDSIEDKIVKGADQTFADPRLKSVLIELDSSRKDYCQDVIDFMEDHGFELKTHKSDADPDSPESKMYNHIFERVG